MKKTDESNATRSASTAHRAIMRGSPPTGPDPSRVYVANLAEIGVVLNDPQFTISLNVNGDVCVWNFGRWRAKSARLGPGHRNMKTPGLTFT